jgi:fermentation-respiration switch protein FrsA (DUF1100 family)
MLHALQRSILFAGQRRPAPDSPRTLPETGERLWLDIESGRVEAWYVPGEGRTPELPGPAVIFAHGNAELIDDWPSMLNWYRKRGIGVLMPEYRGYGRSDGQPSSEAIVADVDEWYRRLSTRPEIDPERIVFHGRSLGGGVVCALARRHAPAAFVLQSTFTSLADLAWHHYCAPSWLLRDHFDNEAVLSALPRPTLITHGSDDEIVPVEHAQRLHETAAESRLLVVDGCGHNDCPMRWDAIDHFWTEHVFSGPRAP